MRFWLIRLSKACRWTRFNELFANRNVVKVFHAARQDLEIFFVEGGLVPAPLFDTQVAAMVCGYGDQVGYETLVRRIAKAGLDKSSRFTDWSRRPLSDAQKSYALADVTHLRQIYEHLSAELARTQRVEWVEEELQNLTDSSSYVVSPEDAWRRLKVRSNSGKFLAIVKELAAFRETRAQERNVPRSRVIKDDALLELASMKPQSVGDLNKSRLLLREARKGELADGAAGGGQTRARDGAGEISKPAKRARPFGAEPGFGGFVAGFAEGQGGEIRCCAKADCLCLGP